MSDLSKRLDNLEQAANREPPQLVILWDDGPDAPVTVTIDGQPVEMTYAEFCERWPDAITIVWPEGEG